MFKLPKLEYDYSALEPYIDEKTMKIHHTKHHQGYVDKLNEALKGSNFKDESIEWLLKNLDKLPGEMRTAVRNNGGGHYNHSLFWQVIGPLRSQPEADRLKGELKEAIKRDFGSFDKFKEIFTKAALTRFGSGWAWLCTDKSKKLHVCSTANQDNCWTGKEGMSCEMKECQPILALDVWEHAYYLKYQNRRTEYVDNFWKVVNWEKVAELYQS